MAEGRSFTLRHAGMLLRVIAALAVGMTMVELCRAGVRWGPLGKSMAYHFAVVAAVAIAADAWIRRRAWSRPVGIAAATFALYLANDQRLMSGDTQSATLVPYALVRHGTLALDDVVPSPLPAWVLRSRGHVWSQYPITTGILALPVYLPAALGPGAPGGQSHAEKVAAALLAALSVGLFVATLRRLGVDRGPLLLVTFAYAFGSSVFSVAAQALWQHTGGIFAFAGALYCIVRAREDARAEPWAGLCLGVAVAARPTNLFAVLALLAIAATRGRRTAGRVLAGAAIPVLLVALYQMVAFGAPWRTGYASQVSEFGAHLATGLTGTLVSPTRGLLTYVPWAGLAVVGLVLGARRDRLFAAALVGVTSIVLVHAGWDNWPGGWGYGPRLVTDSMPLLALGLVPILQVPRARWALPAVVVLVVVATWLAWLGAFRQFQPPAQDVYLGGDVHAMEWWRYPPVTLFR